MRDLPQGTVSFLFSDVEGSTRLMQRYPGGYPDALARHHELLRAAVERHKGVVFETVGDAVYAAFRRVEDAAVAAVEGQRAMSEVAVGGEPLRVRMGIHVGDVELAGDGRHYFGPALYRAARIMAAGHGGQVLASAAAAAILGDHAPSGVALRDLGEHRLKDLLRSERIYQLDAEGVASRYPELRSLDVRPNNLPVQRTPLVGRERELAQAAAILLADDTRLLTFLGPGGIGKTRLSLQVAAEVSDRFGDGMFFVPLAGTSDPELVAGAIAGVLSLRETPGRGVDETVRDFLRGKRLLLIVDNFEHVLDAAPLVGDLLGAGPDLRVLATSQAALRVYGEREFHVPSLALPNGSSDPLVLAQVPAVHLFTQRARDVRPDLDLAPYLPEVAEICKRLDGSPLAIELAAARIRALTPPELLARLDRRLPLLTGGARDAPARQRTLRDAIAWSHDLLDESERRLFRRLAVFNGGVDISSAEAVVAFDGLELEAVVPTIESLAAKSLIRMEGDHASMLATIREFADEQLTSANEAQATRARHAQRYWRIAAESDIETRGPNAAKALQRLDREADNVRAALTWATAHDPALAVRLVSAMGWYWVFRSQYTEAQYWLEIVLDEQRGHSGSEAAWATAILSFIHMERGNIQTALRLASRAKELAREIEDPRVHGMAFAFAEAAALYGERSFDIELLEGLERAAVGRGDTWLAAWVALFLGEAARVKGEMERSLMWQRRTIDGGRASGDTFLMNVGQVNAAHLLLAQGATGEARAMLGEALAGSRLLGLDWTRGYALIALGRASLIDGDAARGAQLLAAAHAWFERMGFKMQLTDREDFERARAAAREALGDAFAEAWQRGLALTLDDASALAGDRSD